MGLSKSGGRNEGGAVQKKGLLEKGLGGKEGCSEGIGGPEVSVGQGGQ